jgi:hypothetical protein
MTPTLKLSAALLAGAAFFAAPAAEAQSCTTAAWTSVQGTATAGTTPAVRRYSGVCGLTAAAGAGYVIESVNHDSEGLASPFRARFFVFPAITAGTATVFQAMDANSGGNAVLEVRYNATSGTFEFTNGVGGNVRATAPAPASRWYRVEVQYEANTAISGSVIGNGGQTYAFAGAAINAGASGINAVRVGAVAGGTGAVFVDEYEASRAALTTTNPFTLICRGDANGDGSIGVGDAIAIANEFGGTRATGQPDCNEDGSIGVGDAVCVANRFATTGSSCATP